MTANHLIRLARALGLVAIAATLAAPALALGGPSVTKRASDSCTMAVPPARATVEVEIANASDFCELVSRALAGDVFRAPVLVTPGVRWHYPDAALSCRLRYENTRHRMTIRNSVAACRWLLRRAPDWRLERGHDAPWG